MSDPWTFCDLCYLPIMSGGCIHTAAQRKAHEEEVSWLEHEWGDPSEEHRLHEARKYDEQDGTYHRIYNDANS